MSSKIVLAITASVFIAFALSVWPWTPTLSPSELEQRVNEAFRSADRVLISESCRDYSSGDAVVTDPAEIARLRESFGIDARFEVMRTDSIETDVYYHLKIEGESPFEFSMLGTLIVLPHTLGTPGERGIDTRDGFFECVYPHVEVYKQANGVRAPRDQE